MSRPDRHIFTPGDETPAACYAAGLRLARDDAETPGITDGAQDMTPEQSTRYLAGLVTGVDQAGTAIGQAYIDHALHPDVEAAYMIVHHQHEAFLVLADAIAEHRAAVAEVAKREAALAARLAPVYDEESDAWRCPYDDCGGEIVVVEEELSYRPVEGGRTDFTDPDDVPVLVIGWGERGDGEEREVMCGTCYREVETIHIEREYA